MSEFSIMNFPTEILEKIFFHFDDTTNATAASVCKRFNEVLNGTIRRKYNGSTRNKWYELEIFDSPRENENNEIIQHHPFILKRVSAIKLTFRVQLDNQIHWIHQVLNQIGRNIRMIELSTPMYDNQFSVNFHNILSKTPNISHLCVDYVYPTNRKWCHQYKNLTHLEFRLRTFFDGNELKRFVKNNGQLKDVKLVIRDFRLLNAFHQSKIESLHCRLSPASANDEPVDIQPIQMAHLKSLELAVPKNLLNECVQNIVAPCQNLLDLCLVHFNDFDLTDESIDILCSLRSLEKFVPCGYMPLEKIVEFVARMPTLISIGLWLKTITIADCRMLMQTANKHPSLRYIHLRNNASDIYNHSLLTWLMNNINDRIQIDNFECYKLVITKGKVQYDGVTIMSSNEPSSSENGSLDREWLQHTELMASINDQYYEFFSNLPILRAHFEQNADTSLHLMDGMGESVVKRRGAKITKASTKLSSNYEESVNQFNCLEKYCHRLQDLYIRHEHNHSQLPVWVFPELNVMRVSCGQTRQESLDLRLFASFQCPKLNCLKFIGFHPISLTNTQVVHDINLFDNLVTLQIFHFNEAMNDLLEKFNRNVQRSLQQLTLANRQVEFQRFKMNNKTIIAIAKFPNLIHLKLILPGLDETNTKYLFEHCTKLSTLYIECNFLSNEIFPSSDSARLFDHIKSNCISLERLQLVWHDRMMEPFKVIEMKSKFPSVFVKIMQIDDRMHTTAEKVIPKMGISLESLFDEFEV